MPEPASRTLILSLGCLLAVVALPAGAQSGLSLLGVDQKARAGGAGSPATATGALPAAVSAAGDSPLGDENKIVGEPVDITTGRLLRMDVDFRVESPVLPLSMVRSYDSSKAGVEGPFGPGWTHVHHRRLHFEDGLVRIQGGSWEDQRFLAGTGTLRPAERGTSSRLEHRDGGYRETVSPSLAFDYDGAGRLIRVTGRGGAAMDLGHDAAGRLVTIRDTAGGLSRITYQDGRIRQVTLPDDRSWTYDYDDRGRLCAVVDPTGARSRYHYDEPGRLAGFDTPLGPRARYGYDAAGRAAWTEDAAGKRTRYAYDPAKGLARQVDPAGKVTLYAHDADGNVISVTDRLGRVTRFEFDPLKNMTARILPGGGTWCYRYRPDRLVESIEDPAGSVTRFEYDGLGRLTARIAPLERVTRYRYDDRGNVVGLVEPGGAVTRITYDRRGLPVTIVDPAGAAHRYEYDDAGRLVVARDPAGRETRFTWTAAHRMATRTLPDGRITRFSYDLAGRPTGNSTDGRPPESRAYDPAGNLVTLVRDGVTTRLTWVEIAYRFLPVAQSSSLGLETRYAYDIEGRVASVTLEGIGSWSFGHDAAGQRVQDRAPDGIVRAYRFSPDGHVLEILRNDAAGRALDRVAYERDALGRSTRVTRGAVPEIFRFDEAGRLVGATGPDGREQRFGYDAADRMTSVTDAAGATWSVAYDPAGRPVRHVDPAGRIRKVTWGNLGQPVLHVDAAGGKTVLAYDPRSLRLTSVHDPLGRVTRHRYGAGGLLEETNNADEGTTTYRHDVWGRLEAVTDARGQTLRIRRNEAGFPVEIRWPGETLTLGYDALGRAVTLENSVALVKRRFDALGRLLSEAVVNRVTGDTTELTYQWDRDRLVRRQGPGDRVASFSYDPAGRLTGLTDRDQLIELDPGPDGRPARIRYPGGLEQVLERDELGRPGALALAMEGRTLLRASWGFDTVGNLVAAADPTGTRERFEYDPLDRLVAASSTGGWRQAFRYDAIGNRTASGNPDQLETAMFDRRGRMVGLGDVHHELDARGAVTAQVQGGARRDLEHDFLGRPTRVRTGKGTVEYFYGPTGRLLARRFLDRTVAYVHDRANPILEDGPGDDDRELVHAPGRDQLLGIREHGRLGAVLRDHQGSVLAMVDASDGKVLALLRYRPWGAPRVTRGRLRTDRPSPLFAGRLYDPAAGLHLFRNRAYDATTGRFTSPDPLGLASGPNRYVLAGGNPLSWIDPFGLKKLTIIENLWWPHSYDYDDIKEQFETADWEVVILSDVSKAGLIEAAQDTDGLLIVSHGGVRDRDKQVGLAWSNWWWDEQIVGSELEEAMQGKNGPEFTISVSCQGGANDSLAKGFGGTFVGFDSSIGTAAGVTYGKGVLRKIADGTDPAQAARTTGISSFGGGGVSAMVYENERRAEP